MDEHDASAARVGAFINDFALASSFPGGLDGPVKVIQTHASVVFLVGDQVFKIKKPIDLGFLDYSTVARRRGAGGVARTEGSRLCRTAASFRFYERNAVCLAVLSWIER